MKISEHFFYNMILLISFRSICVEFSRKKLFRQQLQRFYIGQKLWSWKKLKLLDELRIRSTGLILLRGDPVWMVSHNALKIGIWIDRKVKVDLLSGLAIQFQFRGPEFGPNIECRSNKIKGKNDSIRFGVRVSLKFRLSNVENLISEFYWILYERYSLARMGQRRCHA